MVSSVCLVLIRRKNIKIWLTLYQSVPCMFLLHYFPKIFCKKKKDFWCSGRPWDKCITGDTFIVKLLMRWQKQEIFF